MKKPKRSSTPTSSARVPAPAAAAAKTSPMAATSSWLSSKSISPAATLPATAASSTSPAPSPASNTKWTASPTPAKPLSANPANAWWSASRRVKKDASRSTPACTAPSAPSVRAEGRDGLLLAGQLNDGRGAGGMRFEARLRLVAQGGRVRTEGSTVSVEGADEVLLFVTAATDFSGWASRRIAHADPIPSQPYADLLAAHVADYRQYFDRVSLHLGPGSTHLPTPFRLRAAWRRSNDPALAALYFQFGRYLLISSSRPGGLPANLQGLWAEELQTPWNGDYHLDVNIQMNYWPAEVTNLGDLHQPLFTFIESLVEPGSKTARTYYNARGWVAHVISNIWGYTSPGESASWGSTTTGSAWLCQHLWDHFPVHPRPPVPGPCLPHPQGLGRVLLRHAHRGARKPLPGHRALQFARKLLLRSLRQARPHLSRRHHGQPAGALSLRRRHRSLQPARRRRRPARYASVPPRPPRPHPSRARWPRHGVARALP